MLVLHTDRFQAEMFHNHDFKKWMFFENHAIVALQSDDITFYACKIIKGTSGFNLKKTNFFTRWCQHPNSWLPMDVLNWLTLSLAPRPLWPPPSLWPHACQTRGTFQPEEYFSPKNSLARCLLWPEILWPRNTLARNTFDPLHFGTRTKISKMSFCAFHRLSGYLRVKLKP